MKHIKITGILIILLVSGASFCSMDLDDFIGPTWKVNEYYLNYERYENTTLDSLRYTFQEDGIMEISNPDMSRVGVVSYSFIPGVITINGANSLGKVLDVVHADPANFIFRTTDVDPVTGQTYVSEYRMIPE